MNLWHNNSMTRIWHMIITGAHHDNQNIDHPSVAGININNTFYKFISTYGVWI